MSEHSKVLRLDTAEVRRRQAEKLIDDFIRIDGIADADSRQGELIEWRLDARAFKKRFGSYQKP